MALQEREDGLPQPAHEIGNAHVFGQPIHELFDRLSELERKFKHSPKKNSEPTKGDGDLEERLADLERTREEQRAAAEQAMDGVAELKPLSPEWAELPEKLAVAETRIADLEDEVAVLKAYAGAPGGSGADNTAPGEQAPEPGKEGREQ